MLQCHNMYISSSEYLKYNVVDFFVRILVKRKCENIQLVIYAEINMKPKECCHFLNKNNGY